MIKISDIKSKYDLRISSIKKLGKTLLLDSDKGKYVIKKSNFDTLNYLKSRNFDYIPEIIDKSEDYIITKYVEDNNTPNEYKIMDLIDLVSLLHSKTTYYKYLKEEDYKEIYEDINNNIEYLFSYYDDLATQYETNVYLKPSEYLLLKNMSIILKSLYYCKDSIESWYSLIKEKNKIRVAILHNNLKLDHFIESDSPYLVSWDKSKIGMPIFDLCKLYKRHANEYDFDELLKKYELEYPLFEEEKQLFFILISLPDKILLNESEIINCKNLNYSLNLLKKSNVLINNYNN